MTGCAYRPPRKRPGNTTGHDKNQRTKKEMHMDTLMKKLKDRSTEKGKKAAAAFRASACAAWVVSVYAMPAVMADEGGSSDAARTAINAFIVILLNLALGIGIMMLAHGLFVLLLGHAQEQSPEQSRSIREIAVGIVLIMLRVILAGVDFAGMFTAVTSFGG